MPRNMSSEIIQRHVPSQMSKFPEVTPTGDNKMSGASSHKRLWRGSLGCLSTHSAVKIADFGLTCGVWDGK